MYSTKQITVSMLVLHFWHLKLVLQTGGGIGAFPAAENLILSTCVFFLECTWNSKLDSEFYFDRNSASAVSQSVGKRHSAVAPFVIYINPLLSSFKLLLYVWLFPGCLLLMSYKPVFHSVSQHTWHSCNALFTIITGLVQPELMDVSCRSPVVPKSRYIDKRHCILKQGQPDWFISMLLPSLVITFIFLCRYYNRLPHRLMDNTSLSTLALGLILSL